MLRSIDPLLSPDILFALSSMGHGDRVAIVDANFPATANAQRLIRLPGISATQATSATLSVLPLDTYCDTPAIRMEVVDAPDEKPAIANDFQFIIDATSDNPCQLAALERDKFYAAVRDSFVVIATGETRLYGNLILTKGVIEELDADIG